MTFHPLLMKRRSLRAIDPTQPIPPDVIERLLEAARWAPSSGNAQPWRFVVVRSPEARASVHDGLRRGNQIWAANAPAFIVVCSNPEDDATADGKPYYLFDCGLATENLLLQGIEEGLVLHPMLGFYEEPIHKALALPEAVRVVVVIALGYPGRLEDLPEDLQQRETAERVRKPLPEMVHYDRWNSQEGEQ